MNIASSLQQAAAAAAAGQQYPAAALYVVASPIGNLADLTLRAIHVLGIVDAVACEDTRVSAALLRHLGLHKPTIALHEHNERLAAARVVERLAQGQRVAYLSDAGTPAISDPGAALVAAVREAGHRTIPLPGASSAAAALSVAGDTVGRGFVFVGFPPARDAERRAAVRTIAQRPETQVLFEAPHRIASLAHLLAEAVPARSVTLCRELTKQFEEVVTLPGAGVPAWLAAEPHRSRGEFVLVVHAAPPADADAGAGLAPDAERTLSLLLDEGLALKQAVALATRLTGAPRNRLYERALEIARR